ncbi:MAG: hypothetical protein Q9224_003461 [Gallowayella concinna]
MRFFDSISKCNAAVKILADGQECPQYDISGDEHGNMTCYIPLMSEQVITVDVALDMVSEHFEVDFFVDGVIRNFWQSTRNSVNKHRAPIVGFTQGIYKDTRSMYRNLLTSGSPRANVGSIDIMVSKQDPDRNLHYHGCMVPDDVPKDWYNQALVPTSGTVAPTLQMLFKEGTRMQEADRGGTRIRLKRTRQGDAPWATFKFIYRDPAQLRAAGIGKPVRNAPSLELLTDASRKRPADGDHGDGSLTPEAELQRTRAHVADLRAEILELKMQTDRAKRLRLEKEKETDELARQARQDWADLELAKADLAREFADEQAKAAAQEEEQINIRNRYANASK